MSDNLLGGIMKTYGQSITWTEYGNRSRSTITVDGRKSADQATKDAIDDAVYFGWTPVKWWQWWRANDTKINQQDSHT